MSTFKGNVYWKDQCRFCTNRMFCKYGDAVELLQARLKVVELETVGCYGTLTFWCEYYKEDSEWVREYNKEHMEYLAEKAEQLIPKEGNDDR